MSRTVYFPRREVEEGTVFHCLTSMYITYQQEMDFGEAHNDAMIRRLNKYFFKSLPHVEL